MTEPGSQRRTTSALARSAAWVSGQWRSASTAKRALLVVAALLLLPFLLLWVLIALVHDGVQAIDRGSRLESAGRVDNRRRARFRAHVAGQCVPGVVARLRRRYRVAGEFAIVSPPSGSTVTTQTVTVVGTAPDGAEVVRDVPLRPDVRTVAGLRTVVDGRRAR